MNVDGSVLDFIFLGIFIVALLVGLRVGLINMLAGVAVGVVSYLSIAAFGDALSDIVSDNVELDMNLTRWLVYAAIILVAAAAFAVLAKLTRKVLTFAWLGWVDLLGGALVAIVVSLFIIVVPSGFAVWAVSLGQTAVDGLALASPPALTDSVAWGNDQLSNSFVVNTIGLPLWNTVASLLPNEILGSDISEINGAVDRFRGN